MEYSLNRSIRLLEDSISDCGNTFLLTGAQKPREKDKRAVDLSFTLNTQELQHLELRDSFHSAYDTAFSTLLEGNKTLTGSILRVNEPWKATANRLFSEFYEVLQAHSNGHEVFEVVTDLARCCSDALQVIKGMKAKASQATVEEEVWLENERNTWRLLYVLYQDRLSAQNINTDDQSVCPYFGNSEKLCIANLFKVESLLREIQLAIDWLEYSAAERDEEALHFSDSTVGWENTLHQLQSAETIVFESTRKIVKSMHPDAPHHENLPLHDLDMEDEAKLCRRVFIEIRCGKLERAKDLCISCGHAWRAAILEGWRLYHNPNLPLDLAAMEDMETDDSFKTTGVANEEDLQVTEGNANRDIWKNISYAYCEKTYLNVYERAALAAYCGNLEALLLVSNSWEDALWSYLRVLVDIRVESEIRDSISNKYKPMPDEYWNQKMSLNQVFTSLESSENLKIREEAKLQDHIIQKYIILDEIPALMETMGEWVDEPSVSTQFLRFATHLVLFLDQIGQSCHRDIGEKIIEKYVSCLADMNETQLVAYYVSKLGAQTQVHLYARYLEKILDNDERKEALSFAEDSGLDTHAVTKQVVENIRNRPHEVGALGDLQQRLTETDSLKISALDWLLIYDTQKLDALEQTNALISTFLTLKKLDAAQLAFNKIPPGTVENVISEGEQLPVVNQIVREYLSYKAYLDAQEAFNGWYKQFNSKPIPPERLPENAPFTEKVAHQHRESQFKAETERWKLSTGHLAKIAKAKLYNVLLFPDGGWLTGARDCEFLRSTCIPEVVLLLFSVLHESGSYSESVQLADIIAAEKYGLYEVFSKEKLGDVLVKLCESSVALLNEQKDPWGNLTSE